MKHLINLFINTLGFNEHQCEMFLAALSTRTLKKKQHLIREGSVCNFIGFVSSGTFRSYVTNKEGELNNDFYFENDFASAYTSFLTQLPTNCNIQALTDCTIHTISYEALNKLAADDQAFLKFSKHISDTFFIRKCKRETSFLKNSAKERFENLLSLYPGIEQQISQYHIASYLGVKPESLSRIKLLTYINK